MAASVLLNKIQMDKMNYQCKEVWTESYGFLSRMDTQVNDESLFDREGFATNFATKRFEPSVASQMGFESSHLSKGLLTYVAFEPAGNKWIECNWIQTGYQYITAVLQCVCGYVFEDLI